MTLARETGAYCTAQVRRVHYGDEFQSLRPATAPRSPRRCCIRVRGRHNKNADFEFIPNGTLDFSRITSRELIHQRGGMMRGEAGVPVGRKGIALLTLAVSLGLGGFPTSLPAADTAPIHSCDVLVYGGTAGGISAALAVVRGGRSVILLEAGQHLGGLTSGGLGATDIGNKRAIGGWAREFYRRLGAHYRQPRSWKFQSREETRHQLQTPAGRELERWTFEPHVAEKIFREMLAESTVEVLLGERLDLRRGVTAQVNRITEFHCESGLTIRAKIYIDATYEGDLLAKAGVPYHVGREPNATYGETLNGVQSVQAVFHQFALPVDPYLVPGQPQSGLLWGVSARPLAADGTGDRAIQAYNFRMCLTNVPENRLPFPKPAQYKPQQYELLLRYIQAGYRGPFMMHKEMPNGKTDTNNKGGFSTDYIGGNWDYPEGDYATRQRIFDEHVNYQQGLMWFLANDPRLPEAVRGEMQRWGLAKDEFTTTGGWPHQLYIREARRMISDYVMTQHNCEGRIAAIDAVGLAAYTMDSHHVQRVVRNGQAWNEGDVEVGGFPPYPISYRSIRPREAHCTNLLVPVCLSASHMAYGSIRMEPVFMVLGESAGLAACLALEQQVSVQRIDIKLLQNRLQTAGQVLSWPPPAVPQK